MKFMVELQPYLSVRQLTSGARTTLVAATTIMTRCSLQRPGVRGIALDLEGTARSGVTFVGCLMLCVDHQEQVSTGIYA